MVFQKYSRKIEKVLFRLPSGEESDFYLKAEQNTVAIVALTKDQKVILVRQFRPGPQEILLEIPGGGIDGKETLEEAGARELLEETGYQGKIQVVTTAADCAYSTRRRTCLVATECEKVAGQKLDETEFAEVVLVSLEEFRQILQSGKNTDIGIGYLGLDFLGLL